MTERIQGSCLCQAVRFACTLPSKWVAHCHCSLCRRSHGAGVVTWAGFPATQVTIVDMDGKLRWYESSPGAERGFCSQCGSPMFFRSANWPGELHIARALFADPLDREPAVHVFYGTHVDWLTLGDDLPRKG